ncbi:MAG: TerB family tellurite resistance protein, partial [Thermoanaerobaculales bacterium]
MTTSSSAGTGQLATNDLAARIRCTLGEIDRIDRETTGYLNALAFILQRVAAADHRVTTDEIVRMEAILVEHASITPAQAVLVVEIARHRWRLADCGCAYEMTKDLRPRLETEERRMLLHFLESVAEADG